MIHLVRAEWIKFRSVRSTVFTLLAAGGLVVIVAVLVVRHANNHGETASLGDLTVGLALASFLFGALGVQIIGSEYRFNTIRLTFTAAPHRLRVVIAKLIVACGACSAVSAAMVAVCWLVGTLMADHFVVRGVDRRIAFGIVLFCALWTAAGVGIGAIVRQPIAGILVMVGWSLIGESLLGSLVQATNAWLPYANGSQMAREVDPGSDLQSVLGGGLYFAAICFALVAIGAWLVDRRDA